MGNQVYSCNGYIIIRVSKGYIVLNKRKRFSEGHTHLRSFNTAKYIIHLACHSRMPNDLPIYLLISLLRISDDDIYRKKLEALIAGKAERRQGTAKRRPA